MRRVLTAAIAFVPVLLLLAAPVAAFPLTTCTLRVASTDASGALLDTAQGGAPDGTKANPFEVDWDGQVGYEGSTTVVIRDYTYGISVFGIPTPLQGGGGDAEDTESQGSISVAASSPFRAAGLYHVTGAYAGEGGTCTGSGWFLLRGDPVGTVPWMAGMGFATWARSASSPGTAAHTITLVIGGSALGIGLDLPLISDASCPSTRTRRSPVVGNHRPSSVSSSIRPADAASPPC